MLITTHVFFTVKLVGAHGFTAKERGAGGEVVDIGEAKAFCDLIISAIADTAVDADRRFPALVALQA